MKNKLITTGIVAIIILGGALGVNAFEETSKKTNTPKQTEEIVQQEDVETNAQNNTILTVDEVIQKVEEKFDSVVTEIELDEEDGRLVYEIELYNEKENVEIEIEVDAYTLEVLSLEKEYKDNIKEYEYKNKHEFLGQKKEAIKQALSTVDGNIVDVDYDKGTQSFDIAVKSKDGVTILTIDKNNQIENKITKSYKEYFTN